MYHKREHSKTLTEKQQAVVTLNDYPQYLRAGAGTGKTEVLIQKILHILNTNEDITLKNFGIITFTNKATDEMRDRLRDSLYQEWFACACTEKGSFIRSQVEITSMIDVCTIHGFCERLLRQYGLAIGLSLNFKIKSFRYETTNIVNGIVNEYYDKSFLKGIPLYRITKLIDILLTNNSNRGIIMDEKLISSFSFDTGENDYWNKFKEFYLQIYWEIFNEIETAKQRDNSLIPNDLIRKAVELLRNDYISDKVAKEYRYLFIDEFQDTNKDQFDFVKILISKGIKVFLVGDDKQSVYAFRGADVENSRAMNSLIDELRESKETAKFYLNENFRADSKLIDIVNRIFQHPFTFLESPINFPLEPLEVPQSKINTGVDDCLEIVFGRSIVEIVQNALLTPLNGRQAQYGDIAILCRRNVDLDKIGEILKNAGFPIEIVGGKGFYKSKEIIDTYKLFNAVINKDLNYRNELIFTDYYKAINNNSLDIDFNSFIGELEVIFRHETVEEVLTFIFDKSYILEYYRNKNDLQAVSNLHKLKDISRELMNKESMQPLQFLDYLYIMISTSQEEDSADIPEQERKNGVIRLYSIHKAKGLAFPIVIVPCLDNTLNRPITKPKIILDLKSEPPIIAINNEAVSKDLPIDEDYLPMLYGKIMGHLEEELRIFYVACTRARHKLILACNRPFSHTDKALDKADYASVAKWLCQIEEGKFIKQFMKKE